MKRNNFFSRFITVTLTVALLLTMGSRAIRVSALAVGPLADPVYNTEIYAFKDYVEQNLDNPQLDIMFFLIGGLAVGQLGAQDAQLISPYPNEENVKEWLINCGLQLYNAVIGLVPSGDYYVGIPSIGGAPTKGVPREVIKALVAQMMGDAVVAINYPDLDTFLEDNPDELYIPFNRDLQLGVNAIFGLNGGAEEWQVTQAPWDDGTFNWQECSATGTNLTDYNVYLSQLRSPRILLNSYVTSNPGFDGVVGGLYTDLPRLDLFINITNHTISFHNYENVSIPIDVVFYGTGSYYVSGAYKIDNTYLYFRQIQYNPDSFNSYIDIAKYYINKPMSGYFDSSGLITATNLNGWFYAIPKVSDFVANVYYGTNWETRQEILNLTDLNYEIDTVEYYQQVANDYLLDIRGLIGDLVNYVYVRQPVFDNIYDLEGNNVIPILVKISTELENITNLVAPPIPVNLNDIAEYTDNTYLDIVKERATSAGSTLAALIAFWHNCDAELIYVLFGAGITVLIGAFIGKWGHS